MFTKKNLFFVGFLLISITITLTGCSQKENTAQQEVTPISQNEATTQEDYSQYQSKVSADKIQLYVFHGTIQCWTCITLGELTQKTLDEFFTDEVKSGKISYEDINAELPENYALAQKFNVRNISLYINTITGDSESHEEQVNLMRYLNNEEQFIQALKKKIDGLLGK